MKDRGKTNIYQIRYELLKLRKELLELRQELMKKGDDDQKGDEGKDRE